MTFPERYDDEINEEWAIWSNFLEMYGQNDPLYREVLSFKYLLEDFFEVQKIRDVKFINIERFTNAIIAKLNILKDTFAQTQGGLTDEQRSVVEGAEQTIRDRLIAWANIKARFEKYKKSRNITNQNEENENFYEPKAFMVLQDWEFYLYMIAGLVMNGAILYYAKRK